MISGEGFPAGRRIEAGIGVTAWPLHPRTPQAHDHRSLLRTCILSIDRLLRWRYGVHEFADTDDNLLRISVSIAAQRIDLADGTEILPGDCIIDLHLWNERIPALGPLRSSGLGWGSRARRRMERSLTTLAAHVEANQPLQQCKAFRAEAVFLTGRRIQTLARIAERLGLGPPIELQQADLGHTMLALALAWACHPGRAMTRRLTATRYTFWMSRRTLRDRYFQADGGSLARCDGRAADLHSGPPIGETSRWTM